MSKPPKVDSMKETIRREKGGGGQRSKAPATGSGAGGGQPTNPEGGIDPSRGQAPFAEPGLVGSGKRAKRGRSY
jgi:hypothetical protein